jgi:GDP/UDP-N,N'-diacetylbacillosamine 2-epimerase (hydrolysing)
MSRRICVITGTRAEYGLLKLLMQRIRDDVQCELQLIATGMHLSPEYGASYRIIEADGFRIDRKVEMLLSSDSAVGIGKSVGLGVIGFAEAFEQLHPDLIIVLGDRFEILSAVTAALFARIPVLHIHGGEVTEGAVDESMRHAITKMSHVHCVATEEYRYRVIQLGEQPGNVHCVGGLGVDVIKHITLLNQTELESALDFQFKHRNLLITFHPETLADDSGETQMAELLKALGEMDNTGLIFTFPNADTGGRQLIVMLQDFVTENSNARVYSSLGQLLYLSCMSLCDGVIGNSSSGLLEAPTLKKGAVNIGDRQRGRLQAASVINSRPTYQEIKAAIQQLYSPTFQASLIGIRNPYGDGGATERIFSIIKGLRFDYLARKPFYDLPVAGSASGESR